MRNHLFFIDQLEEEKDKERAIRNLNQVVNFSENITCRRKFILSYFGENYQKNNCKGCDNCLRVADKFDATVISQKIISCIFRLGNRFGKGHVADVLIGKINKKFESWQHHKLPVFGIVQDYSRDELFQIMEMLIAVGLLERAEGRFPVLIVSNEGANFLREKRVIKLPKPIKNVRKSKSIKNKKIEEEGDFNKELFEELRVLRKSLADDLKVPPFVVFSDVSLRAMSRELPQDDQAFLAIHGVGQSKLNKFGEAFMEAISAFVSNNNIVQV